MNTPLLPAIIAVCYLAITTAPAPAVALAEYAKAHPLKLFVAKKGAVMPNEHDQTNNLLEGDRALLLSDAGLDDLAGISTLTVEDEGKAVPITAVKNLHLFLNKNRIATIPDEFAALAGVTFLYAMHNELHALPTAIARMPSLLGIYCSGNHFTEIPPFIFGITQLKKLQFSENQVAHLPPELGNLTELRHFNMARNLIAEVPASIARLTKLRVCDLSDNPIRTLPEEFGQVRIFNQLRVRNTLLTTLPAGFAEMRATIAVTGSKIDPATLSPELRARLSTEKPPDSKDPETIVVKAPEKKKQGR
jgi:hypothetical protein